MKTILSTTLVTVLILWAAATANAAATIDFEDLSLSPDSYYNGSDFAGGFTSGGAFFANSFTDFGSFTSWDGFAYSNVNDIVTVGYTNQYAAYTGTGFGGAGNYAVAYAGPATFINLPAGHSPASAYLTNTTYAALDMLNGSGFSKKFGGVSGNDPDYFSVTLTGYDAADAAGSSTGSVTFYLADYRFADNALDYIVNDWTLVDLTSLGNAASIGLSWASSDESFGWINTPTYVALDNLVTTPEPASIALLAIGASTLIARRRRHA